jgi:aldehyde dehydrogenase (NAD+)
VTRCSRRVCRRAWRIETGTFGINQYQPDIYSPMSMIKSSGLGLKLGSEALISYHRFQTVYL